MGAEGYKTLKFHLQILIKVTKEAKILKATLWTVQHQHQARDNHIGCIQG